VARFVSAAARAVHAVDGATQTTATLSDLVAVTGVSERALRAGFHKFFGVFPRGYMQLRRLHQARRMLSDGRPG
jgi:AraC-like DNA-binding protein